MIRRPVRRAMHHHRRGSQTAASKDLNMATALPMTAAVVDARWSWGLNSRTWQRKTANSLVRINAL